MYSKVQYRRYACLLRDSIHSTRYHFIQQGAFLYITGAETCLKFISKENIDSCSKKICESICREILSVFLNNAYPACKQGGHAVYKLRYSRLPTFHTVYDFLLFLQFTIFYYFWPGRKNFFPFSISQCWQVWISFWQVIIQNVFLFQWSRWHLLSSHVANPYDKREGSSTQPTQIAAPGQHKSNGLQDMFSHHFWTIKPLMFCLLDHKPT